MYKIGSLLSSLYPWNLSLFSFAHKNPTPPAELTEIKIVSPPSSPQDNSLSERDFEILSVSTEPEATSNGDNESKKEEDEMDSPPPPYYEMSHSSLSFPSEPDENESKVSDGGKSGSEISVEKQKKKKKNKVDDDGDSDDEEVDKKHRPSKKKLFLITTVQSVAAICVMYFQVNPVVSVPVVGLYGSNVKTIARRVGRKKRYAILTLLTVAGYVVDYYAVKRVVNVPTGIFGPIATSVLVAVLSRTMKLFILGKLKKDKS